MDHFLYYRQYLVVVQIYKGHLVGSSADDILPLVKDCHLNQDIGDNIGSEPNIPVPIELLPSAYQFLPLKPEESIKQGLKWDRTIYCTPYTEMFRPELVFPVKIVHKVIGFEIKKGKKMCEN